MSSAKIGSVGRPLENDEIMTVAEGFVMSEGMTEDGGRGMWWWNGMWWVWVGGRWVVREHEEVEFEVLKWLRDTWARKGEVAEKVESGERKCKEVAWVLKGVCKAPWKEAPVWVKGREGKPDPKRCIAFEDVVLSVVGGKVEVVGPRDESWFSPLVVPCEWDPEAKCPRWEQALVEWGCGDEEWGKLLDRWMGYCLMSHREYRKWLLLHGKTGGGKGVTCHVMHALMGQAMMSSDMDGMAGEFGLGGVQYVNCVSVTEVSKLNGVGGQRFGKVAKQIVGGDPITINEKHVKVQKNVPCHAALMMSANMIPTMPNENRGLSAKMLVLPFQVSFDDGGAEIGLKDRLVREELAGIARRAVEAAAALEGATDGERWPVPVEARETEQQFTLTNNPVDQFLHTYFVEAPDGFVSSETVKRQWREFTRKNEVPSINENMLLIELLQRSSWKIRRYRKPEGGKRGVQGMSLRREFQEDL